MRSERADHSRDHLSVDRGAARPAAMRAAPRRASPWRHDLEGALAPPTRARGARAAGAAGRLGALERDARLPRGLLYLRFWRSSAPRSGAVRGARDAGGLIASVPSQRKCRCRPRQRRPPPSRCGSTRAGAPMASTASTVRSSRIRMFIEHRKASRKTSSTWPRASGARACRGVGWGGPSGGGGTGGCGDARMRRGKGVGREECVEHLVGAPGALHRAGESGRSAAFVRLARSRSYAPRTNGEAGSRPDGRACVDGAPRRVASSSRFLPPPPPHALLRPSPRACSDAGTRESRPPARRALGIRRARARARRASGSGRTTPTTESVHRRRQNNCTEGCLGASIPDESAVRRRRRGEGGAVHALEGLGREGRRGDGGGRISRRLLREGERRPIKRDPLSEKPRTVSSTFLAPMSFPFFRAPSHAFLLLSPSSPNFLAPLAATRTLRRSVGGARPIC